MDIRTVNPDGTVSQDFMTGYENRSDTVPKAVSCSLLQTGSGSRLESPDARTPERSRFSVTLAMNKSCKYGGVPHFECRLAFMSFTTGCRKH